MSTSGLMSIGLRAMTANSAALQVTGHNIANANVDGYSRQSAILQTNTGQFTGAGFFGKGSSVVDVRRAHDDFLTAQVQAATSLAKMDETRAAQLTQLQDVFPSGEAGIGYAMGDFLSAVADLGNSPADYSSRQVVLARASDVSARFSTAAERLDVLQAGVRSDLAISAKTVNSLAGSVAALNQQIASVYALDQKPNDLLDQRDEMVRQLGEYIQVSTVQASDGSVGLFVAGGQSLVLGNEAASLVVGNDDSDPSRAALSLKTANGQTVPIGSDLITGGSMVGLLKFQNEDLVDARNSLGQMAAAFAGSINAGQSLGIDLNGDAGAPLFATGGTRTVPNAHNRTDASGQLLTQASVTVVDYSALQASDYRLERDPSDGAKVLVTRLSDGKQQSLADSDASDGQFTATIDGFQITLSTTTVQPGDRFLLQPVGRAATGMTRALDDPTGIAAAAPLAATADVDNKGTARVSSLTMNAPKAVNALTFTFGATSTPAAGTTLEDGSVLDGSTQAIAYSWSGQDNAGNPVSGTSYWVPGHAIGEVAGSGIEVALSGTPKSGDKVLVQPTQYPATNNGNALQMSALSTQTFVGRTATAEGTTLTDAYANVMADVGVRVQSLTSSSKISASALSQAKSQAASNAGVNLDEEAAALLQFQQSYQAAAKVLQVAQQVFDTMLQMGN